MFYWFVKYSLLPWFKLCFRPVVRGRHNVPASGGALLASNHLSMCDSLFLPVLIRRRVTFLAKQEYFTGRGVKGRAKAAFVRGTGLIPVNRADSNSAEQALAAGARAVRAGRLLAIYPEGSRSPDGRLYRGKTGLARIAIETQVPVIPVAMIGTDQVQPIGKVLPRRARISMFIGSPIEPPTTTSGSGREQAREFTERIMTAIADLSGQQRASLDAAAHKLALVTPSGRDRDHAA